MPLWVSTLSMTIWNSSGEASVQSWMNSDATTTLPRGLR